MLLIIVQWYSHKNTLKKDQHAHVSLMYIGTDYRRTLSADFLGCGGRTEQFCCCQLLKNNIHFLRLLATKDCRVQFRTSRVLADAGGNAAAPLVLLLPHLERLGEAAGRPVLVVLHGSHRRRDGAPRCHRRSTSRQIRPMSDISRWWW